MKRLWKAQWLGVRVNTSAVDTRRGRPAEFADNDRVHFVYIVRCADGTLYTGYARDPEARARAHNAGRGARYTAGRRPVEVVYVERFRSKGKALSREHQVKQLPRAGKEALISCRRSSSC